MASPRKKKMVKYMIDDLLAIAKEQIIRLNPNLEKEYISKKSECIVCTSLVTLTDADVKIIKMNEKLLQEKENGSSAN